MNSILMINVETPMLHQATNHTNLHHIYTMYNLYLEIDYYFVLYSIPLFN